MKVIDIYRYIDEIAPFELAMPWDNSGLLVGDENAEINKVLVSLDITLPVIERAVLCKAGLIISHHPVIFDPIKSITSDSILYKLVQSGISVIAAHTNLDLARDGVNDALAKTLELIDVTDFQNIDSIGRVGRLVKPTMPKEFAAYLKEKLKTPVFYTDCQREISSVALVGGSGDDYYKDSKTADAYLTGEVSHHIYCYAQNENIQLFTVGHYASEAVILKPLAKKLSDRFCKVAFEVYNKSGIEFV